ncbi:brain protein I3-like [Brienomyrus brachyistius]|uniref:brain protein I3-like n=1 Tax=Brienomyrus brachyistius TaxID=42636 RepID=UPI0020B36C36|nr:brain protein I3-like [Brienomyrus brachyistius]XP_048846791.1 brain protein I3-like [Brienomyrus brachyistius]XP_048846792.1 brain protein I3-like [Brienomyrus brachyistius]XP_048846793.1 brain protein I3-like [Brienomyrus brachyistius]XP_048846794.1 brain protein I3-like [Brienomyrus brachyistius]XP_048846795.1 brain protein I3-like [Brienomyrus brachyistius]
MDSKPLVQDRPPAYSVAPGGYEYGQQPQHNYGAIRTPGPPPPGYQPPLLPYQCPSGSACPQLPSIGQQPSYTNTYTIIQPSVVVVGGCPACRVGVLEDDFTCLGLLCAIFFFPIGIIFCFALRQRRCPNCGATFG